MTIGILTSGGDCPGLNAVIRSAVFKGIQVHHREFVGFRNGWKGVVEGDIVPLERRDITGISKQGGTILGTSRTNPFDGEGGAERVRENMERLGVDSIIAIGGEGTLAAAKRLRMPGSRSSACRRRSTMTSPPPTTASDSTPPCRSRPTPWTGCARPGIAPPVHGRGGDGSRRRLDRAALRHGGRRPRHPDPGAEDHDGAAVPLGSRRLRSRARTARGGRRGLHLRDHEHAALRARHGRIRAPPARRDRRAARSADRGGHRYRDAGDDARPHPARRHPDRVRPGARHPVRPRRNRRGSRGTLGTDGGAHRNDDQQRAFGDALGRLKTVPQARYDEAAILFG